MRIRTIKPEFWTDSFMVTLPPLARLIFLSLLSVADDHGCFEDEVERVAMLVMPKEPPLLVADWLDFFVASGRIEQCVGGGEDGTTTYFRIKNFGKHQKVDHPSKSKFSRESSRKLAIPLEVRRGVAKKYKCEPGKEQPAQCYYCGAEGKIHWHQLRDGRPSSWVSFAGLELDHFMAESAGGSFDETNIVLACRGCNRSKGKKEWLEFLSSRDIASPRETYPPTRELSGLEQGSGNREKEQGSGNGNTGAVAPAVETPPVADRKRPERPTIEDWLAYGHSLSPDWPPANQRGAFDHYEANGWRQASGNTVKDWKACCRTCFQRWQQEPRRGGTVARMANPFQTPAPTAEEHRAGFFGSDNEKPK